VTADPGTSMAAASASEIPRDWRLVALIGCVCFPASFALFHYVVPLGARVAAAPELLVSAFCAGLTTVLAMLLAGIAITRRIQVDNKRMRVAINNMCRACACSTATSGWSFAIATTWICINCPTRL